ncbi:MAG TPA: JAB domain-containing protein [Candidatus Desulfofervidus auxilii]|uniref:JAB domain-containing protein n=1 Tax=Desulfofervidus auxilii TaxID=1621989 RepID=A0A7C0Y1M2_DESA2|nr:JAB domain-containing protein [Candidatus Desulfofervidus auxilii]
MKYKIPSWPIQERPREKLLNMGAHSLTEAELLAILIGKGTKEKTAVDLGRELLIKFENLFRLSQCNPKEYGAIKGIGMAKAVILAAAFELAKRLQAQKQRPKRFKTPEDVAMVYLPLMRGLKKEIFKVLLLNSANQLIKEVTVSEGTLNTSIVHPREVFREAIIEAARSIILIHNHPSGNPTPSEQDIKITHQLIQAGEIIGIPILDHIILGNTEFFSFAKKGWLK